MGQIVDRLALLPRKPLVLVFFAVDTILYALAAVTMGGLSGTIAFFVETLSIIPLLWCCAIASIVVESSSVFLIVNLSRAILTVPFIVQAAGRRDIAVILAVAPLLLDTFIYARTLRALLLSTIPMIATFFARAGLGTPDPDPVAGAALSATLAAIALPVALMARYREVVVEKSRRIRELDLSIRSLESTNQSFQEYAEVIEGLSEENERNRISREIHDTLGYALTNVGMLIQAAKRVSTVDPGKLGQIFDDARAQVNSALQESRKILHSLRAIKSSPARGLSAIARLVRNLREATGIDVEVSFANAPQSLGEEIDKALYRFIQEGITNAIRHGTADTIRISFWLGDAELQARVWDNGIVPDSLTEGIGMQGMRERFAAFGGRIEAGSAADGFLLSVHLPIEGLRHENE